MSNTNVSATKVGRPSNYLAHLAMAALALGLSIAAAHAGPPAAGSAGTNPDALNYMRGGGG